MLRDIDRIWEIRWFWFSADSLSINCFWRKTKQRQRYVLNRIYSVTHSSHFVFVKVKPPFDIYKNTLNFSRLCFYVDCHVIKLLTIFGSGYLTLLISDDPRDSLKAGRNEAHFLHATTVRAWFSLRDLVERVRNEYHLDQKDGSTRPGKCVWPDSLRHRTAAIFSRVGLRWSSSLRRTQRYRFGSAVEEHRPLQIAARYMDRIRSLDQTGFVGTFLRLRFRIHQSQTQGKGMWSSNVTWNPISIDLSGDFVFPSVFDCRIRLIHIKF